MRVPLPRDQWAEFRELDDLKGGDAKAIRRATKFEIRDGQLTEISMGLEDAQMDALLARIITSWSLFDYGLPMRDPTSLDEIPLDTYNALVEAAKPYKDAIDKTGKASTPANGTGSTTTSSPSGQATPILQGSAISPQESSTTSSSGAGSPNDGTGPQPSPSSSPSTF